MSDQISKHYVSLIERHFDALFGKDKAVQDTYLYLQKCLNPRWPSQDKVKVYEDTLELEVYAVSSTTRTRSSTDWAPLESGSQQCVALLC